MHLKLNTRCPTTHQSLQTRTQHHTTQITISQTGCLCRLSTQPQGSSPSRLHATCTHSITHLHTFDNPPTQQTQSPISLSTQTTTNSPQHHHPLPPLLILNPSPSQLDSQHRPPAHPCPTHLASVNYGGTDRVLTPTTSGPSRPTSSSIQTFISPHARQRCAWLGR
jgi:hypothetical protein